MRIHTTHQLRRIVILVAAGLAPACQGLALDPRQPLNSYLRTTFSTGDGLCCDIVNGIAQ
jgi:hypothetical protein